VAAARAADGDGEVRLPLAAVEREGDVEQAAAGSPPVFGRSSSTKNGLARKRASRTMSASLGAPNL
jgi:hypothetical protein